MRFTAPINESILALVATEAAGGWVRFYDNTKPADITDAPGTPPCAEVRLANPAFDTPHGDQMALLPLVSGEVLIGATLPTWFRIFKADGTTGVGDGTAGVGGELQLTAGTFQVGLSIEAQGVVLRLLG